MRRADDVSTRSLPVAAVLGFLALLVAIVIVFFVVAGRDDPDTVEDVEPELEVPVDRGIPGAPESEDDENDLEELPEPAP